MGEPLRVLVVEDSEDDALLVVRELKQGGYDPLIWKRVEIREEIINTLETEKWDVIISDYALPGFSGADALKICHQKGIDIPFIVISGTIGEVTAVKMMKAGAHDYIMKENLARLVPVVQRELAEAQGRREHKKTEEERIKLQQQLVQAQKMESIGRLAGGVAHDFNNLLTPILGHVDILMETIPISDPRHESLIQILHASERARDLTRQLLAFSRKQILQLEIMDVQTAIISFEKMLRRTIREDIQIELALHSQAQFVRADIGQLEQVLMNLAVNAQDAMPEGGTLTISSQNASFEKAYEDSGTIIPPGNYVVLTVKDTGCGMNKDVMSHLFEPFFTTKEIGKGTGLGLSTVYGIVKQHEGYIHISSTPGMGTTFKIYLPGVTGIEINIASPNRKPDIEGGTETILVVEDNDTVRDMIFQMLRRKGYNVIVAENPKQCIETIVSDLDKIDLLLTDVIMPGMNGKELYEILAAKKPDLRVLFMSGYDSDVVAHHGVLDKSIHFLHKPFGSALLTEKVRKILNS